MTVIDKATFPLLPTKDTAERMRHFPESVFRVDESSILYKYVDAIVGDSGVGGVKKQLLISRLNQKLDTTFFTDLDRVFGNLAQITRTVSESYTINPSTDLLTTAEWDEIKIKDAWYRARIKDFFAALALGGSPDGIRKMVKAAIGVDCEVYELWRFQDYYADIYGISDIETITNLVTTPSFEYAITNWLITTGGTGSSLASATSPAGSIQSGTHSLLFTTGTTVTDPTIRIDNIKVSANKQYTFSLYYYAPAISPLATANLIVTNKNTADGTISTLTSSAQTLAATTRTRISYTFTTPALTDHVTLSLKLVGSVTTPTSTFYIDAVQLTAGTIVSYFDGDTSGYRWTGDAGSSTSIQASPIDALSRLKVPSRNEIIIYPHKATLTTLENVMIRSMTTRLAPVDSIITIRNSGYAVNKPISTSFTTADSTYFQINSYVEGFNIQELTAEEEPNSTKRWLKNGVEVLAPNPAFLESQEYSQYYVYSDSDVSSIDSVQYFKEPITGTASIEQDYKIIEKTISAWSQWTLFDVADAPDNFPGGKNGQHPQFTPALTPNGGTYVFPYSSQEDYIAQMKVLLSQVSGEIRVWSELSDAEKSVAGSLITEKGEFTEVSYRLPVGATEHVINTWKPEEAVANKAPAKASTVTAGWYSRPLIANSTNSI